MNSSVWRSNFSSLQQAVLASYLWKTADVRFIYSFAKLLDKPPLELAHPIISVKPNTAENSGHHRKWQNTRENRRSTVLERTPLVHPVAQGIINSARVTLWQMLFQSLLKDLQWPQLSQAILCMIVVGGFSFHMPHNSQFESALLHLNSLLLRPTVTSELTPISIHPFSERVLCFSWSTVSHKQNRIALCSGLHTLIICLPFKQQGETPSSHNAP